MVRRSRSVWIAAIATLVFAAVASFVTFPAGAYKDLFERAASHPLGLRVEVDGPLSVRFAGDLVVQAGDVRVRNRDGEEVLRADRATISVAPFPLLFQQSRIHRIDLLQPRITIARGSDGTINWSRRDEPRGLPPILDGTTLSIAEGAIHYRDEAAGARFDAMNVGLLAREVRQGAPDRMSLASGLSFRADLACDEIRGEHLAARDLRLTAVARNGVLTLDPIRVRLFGGEGSASVRTEQDGPIPHYRVRFTLSRFEVGSCLRTISPDTIATGTMDFAANLSLSGPTPDSWAKTIRGDVSLRGSDLTLRGRDLDKAFSRFESSQSLDLVDVGSFFFVGPIGVAVTKGFDFARLVGHSKGSTRIDALVSAWKVGGGRLRAKDVAMATPKNRVALRGNLDFLNQRFDSVTVALVDKNGCASAEQEVRGTFRDPELTKPTVLSALLGPAKSVVKGAKDLLPGGCKAFYDGSVEAPD